MSKRSFYHSIVFMLVALAALILPIFVMDAGAIDLVPANQLTIAWDPVTLNDDGTGVEPGQVVEYQVYIERYGPAGVDRSQLGTTEETQYTISFPGEGIWVFGFASKKYSIVSDPDGGPDQRIYSGESEISWSGDPTVCQGGVNFAGVYLKIPQGAGGLRTQ